MAAQISDLEKAVRLGGGNNGGGRQNLDYEKELMNKIEQKLRYGD